MIMPLWSGVNLIVCGSLAQLLSPVVQAQVPCTTVKMSWSVGTSYGRSNHR